MNAPQGNTKFVILVGDGMADYPVSELGGKTVLETAHIPHMDRIASCGIGLARTIPLGMEPGSDIANLALLGYDPSRYHTGRAPLEAVSMGIDLKPPQIAFRMNLVTLDVRSDNEVIMVSHSAGDISNEEAHSIVEHLKKEFTFPGISLYSGVAYRHLLIWHDGPVTAETIPPHDVLDQNMSSFLNSNQGNPVLDLIKKSWPVLQEHPVNQRRRKEGFHEANSIWLWGQGKAPELPLFRDRYHLSGGVIAAVDLIKGLGISAGFRPIHVEGATGYLDTNYQGKAEGALHGLQDLDMIFLHVEAPDEASHQGNTHAKIEALEAFDQKVVGTVMEGLTAYEDYRIMVVSDHYTPLSKKTHTGEPTPFAWARKRELESSPGQSVFTEKAAFQSGLFFDKGYDLMGAFLDLEES